MNLLGILTIILILSYRTYCLSSRDKKNINPYTWLQLYVQPGLSQFGHSYFHTNKPYDKIKFWPLTTTKLFRNEILCSVSCVQPSHSSWNSENTT